MRTVWSALYLSLPLVVAGILHMVVVKADLLRGLKRPIDEARFGPNKTWRGFVVMPIVTVLGVYAARALEPSIAGSVDVSLTGVSPIALGVALGLAYVIAELPNSWMKRRLGIAAGELPESNRALFAIVDQADSAVGCAIAYALLVRVPLVVLAVVVVIGPAVHLIVNMSLFAAGLRKRPV